MGQLEKLLSKIKNNPKSVRFEELDKILRRAGFERRKPRSGSSHVTYFKNGKILTIPMQKPFIKSIYVERAIELLEGEEL